MTPITANEVIAVRSLTNSDLGIFAAHRPTTSSKQRALNINSEIAQRLFSKSVTDSQGHHFECDIIFINNIQSNKRHVGKVGKNWRFGGNKIDGEDFLKLDSKDFALIKSVEGNDGSHKLSLLFVSRQVERLVHARIGRLLEPTIKNSMAIYREGSAGFKELALLFPAPKIIKPREAATIRKPKQANSVPISPMPFDKEPTRAVRSVREKIRSAHFMELILKASSDLSAPAQVSFMDTVEKLSEQLRKVLLASNRIIKLTKNHSKAWSDVKGQLIGFVDGGLANLSMLGTAPIAARVGGYIVRPGDTTSNRERFIMLKKLINELYTSDDDGVYDGSFPDVGALRDAARISIESAGAVRLIDDEPSLSVVFLHGALVNPVSRYTDIMRDGQTKFSFPNFSVDAQKEFLPNGSKIRSGRDGNFIKVHLQQLLALQRSKSSVCGVVEREATTSSIARSVLNSLEDHVIAPYLPVTPEEWKSWFRSVIDPVDEDDALGQRITDSLLFRCVLEPGEFLVPVSIDRNEMRRAPAAWHDVISQYPKPFVSYLQPHEWSSPIRLEIFEKDLIKFESIANLILHCSLLLPRYAFPAGLDIVDKFAKIPNWMTKPVNTNTAVQALKGALNKGDEKLFDTLRKMLCGSNREWLLRPGVYK